MVPHSTVDSGGGLSNILNYALVACYNINNVGAVAVITTTNFVLGVV